MAAPSKMVFRRGLNSSFPVYANEDAFGVAGYHSGDHADNPTSVECQYATNSSFTGATSVTLTLPSDAYGQFNWFLTGITTTTKHWLRVRGINSDGTGPWNDGPVTAQYVPYSGVWSNPLPSADTIVFDRWEKPNSGTHLLAYYDLTVNDVSVFGGPTYFISRHDTNKTDINDPQSKWEIPWVTYDQTEYNVFVSGDPGETILHNWAVIFISGNKTGDYSRTDSFFPFTEVLTTYIPYTTATAPGAASGLTSTNITIEGADLGWSAITNAQAVEVEYTYDGTSRSVTLPGAATSYTLKGVPASKVVSWRVRGKTYFLDFGQDNTKQASDVTETDGAWSSSISFTTGNPTQVPQKITGLSASNLTGNRATVSWSSDLLATKYTLRYGRQANLSDATTITDITGTSYDLTGLLPSTTYRYDVMGVNNIGDGTRSDIASFQTTVLLKPGPITVSSATNITEGSATINFTGVGNATGYKFRAGTQQDLSAGVEIDVSPPSFPMQNLIAGTTYYYQIRGTGTDEDGDWSQVFSFTTLITTVTYPKFGYCVKITNFWPSTFSDRDLRLTTFQHNTTIANEVYQGGLLDYNSISALKMALNENRPHSAFDIFRRNEAINQRFREVIGTVKVEIFGGLR